MKNEFSHIRVYPYIYPLMDPHSHACSHMIMYTHKHACTQAKISMHTDGTSNWIVKVFHGYFKTQLSKMPDCWMSTPRLYSPAVYGCVLQLELFLCDWSYRTLLKNSKKKRRWAETDCFCFELIGKLPENDFFHLYLRLCHLFQYGNHLNWCTYTEEGERKYTLTM